MNFTCLLLGYMFFMDFL